MAMKKTKKYYWKIVMDSFEPGVFTSCIIDEGQYCLTYKVGERTKSAMDENGIFVFDTRKNARAFQRSMCISDSRIFKCTVQGEECYYPVYYNSYVLKHFDMKESSTTNKFPDGTKSFPAITLIKQSR